jgi:hypothetical protein
VSNGPLTLRDLLKKLKKFGVIVLSDRGKGSEIILVRPDSPGSYRGPQYPVKNHGPGTEIKPAVIRALLRRFNIDPTEFWR